MKRIQAHLKAWGRLHPRFYYDYFFEDFVPSIAKHCSSNECDRNQLLEIGCGFGEKSAVFDDLGFDVVALDYDEARIANARNHAPNVDFRVHNLCDKLPLEDNTCNFVFSNGVFQYIDHDFVISECYRVLKPGGSIILIENLKNNPFTRIARTYLKLRKNEYQSYPYNHLKITGFNKFEGLFSTLHIEARHIFLPLCHIKFLEKFQNIFSSIDSFLLDNVPWIKKCCWLVLYIGEVKK